ncbi:PD-(D/E)XK motif protein [Streptomyces sp. Ru72]|uniref:PD-(D/E)XK motif protein n=1 Tax=Streptomyces sp. Ru72 TaxID=2080747 RepID=UPI000CDD2C17|nr:PD-(D/E)XK motif protein [Streptomyces sp. Ru72]POX44214.1 PD-(D/E)XK motif protein [Streptomyces sp. Ru72]
MNTHAEGTEDGNVVTAGDVPASATSHSAALPWTSVEHYLGRGLAASYRLSATGKPLVSYEIADGGRGIALHVELDRRHRPPRSPLPAVRIEQIARPDGRRMARITTPEPELLRDFHDMLLAVAGRIIAGGQGLDEAFDETVHGWGALLGRPRRMSLEKRLGLHGELAVLGRIARGVGWSTALDTWVGPTGEEHDFALGDADLEVKTTAAEARKHTIHGLGQLSETPGRPLWFASLRLTRGGAGGRTLGDSVRATRDAAAAENIALGRRLDRLLEAVGWDSQQPDDERWTPRDSPLVLRATDMPRLTDDDLPGGADGRIDRVTYGVDVTGLPPADRPPIDLSDLVLP